MILKWAGMLRFSKHFEELVILAEFEKDKLLTFTDGGFELTELGTHFSQICEVFDKYAGNH